MSIDTHPDLAAEQRYVDDAYEHLRAMYERVERFGMVGADALEQQAFDRWREARLASLSDNRSALVFGRIDARDAARWYIGRRHVEDAEGEVVVVDWRAPVATAFYRASGVDPMGLERRRHFLVEGRRLIGIADESFDEAGAQPDGTVSGWEALQLALERRRGGQMEDIAATIQAEQDVVIRAPLDGVLVVQGGPGTGKTAIGLHRAAYLLYEHRRTLLRQGVLVVGPNRVFIKYVSQVLPSLGEYAVEQRAVETLGPAVPLTLEEPVGVERLKGDPRLALVIERLVWSGVRAPEEPLVVPYRTRRLEASVEDLRAMIESARSRGIPYRRAREGFRSQAVMHLYRAFQADAPTALPFEEFARAVGKDAAFKQMLARCWPALSEQAVVRALGQPQRLADAADGLLSRDEQRLLRRRGSGKAWSRADLALLDEARAVLEGTPESFGHLVVDETQDLSPMQLRMLARRCPSGSVTVLGDLAQATSAWQHASWDEVAAHLAGPAGYRVEELTLGYRVAEEIMRPAARVLAAVAPGLRPPRAVRAGGSVRYAATDDLVGGAVAVVRAMAAQEGAFAIIAPDALVDDLAKALAEAGVTFGEARREALEHPISLVAARECKGLEFDGVVLVEPAAIAEETGGGLKALYIALTRAMRELVVLHERPLPDALRDEPAGAALAS